MRGTGQAGAFALAGLLLATLMAGCGGEAPAPTPTTTTTAAATTTTTVTTSPIPKYSDDGVVFDRSKFKMTWAGCDGKVTIESLVLHNGTKNLTGLHAYHKITDGGSLVRAEREHQLEAMGPGQQWWVNTTNLVVQNSCADAKEPIQFEFRVTQCGSTLCTDERLLDKHTSELFNTW